jgi:dTMP kinase
VSADKVRQLEAWVQGEFQPDLTLLFDVPVSVSTQRLAGARDPDRFERENGDFFERIRQAYLARASEFSQRFRIVDSGKTLDEISKELEEILASI